MRLQSEKNIAQRRVFDPCATKLLAPPFSEPRYFRKAMRFGIQDPQALQAKILDDTLRKTRSDPSNHAATQVLLQSSEGIWSHSNQAFDSKPLTVARITFQPPRNSHLATWPDSLHHTYCGDLCMSGQPCHSAQSNDAKTSLLVRERHSFDFTQDRRAHPHGVPEADQECKGRSTARNAPKLPCETLAGDAEAKLSRRSSCRFMLSNLPKMARDSTRPVPAPQRGDSLPAPRRESMSVLVPSR